MSLFGTFVTFSANLDDFEVLSPLACLMLWSSRCMARFSMLTLTASSLKVTFFSGFVSPMVTVIGGFRSGGWVSLVVLDLGGGQGFFLITLGTERMDKRHTRPDENVTASKPDSLPSKERLLELSRTTGAGLDQTALCLDDGDRCSSLSRPLSFLSSTFGVKFVEDEINFSRLPMRVLCLFNSFSEWLRLLLLSIPLLGSVSHIVPLLRVNLKVDRPDFGVLPAEQLSSELRDAFPDESDDIPFCSLLENEVIDFSRLACLKLPLPTAPDLFKSSISFAWRCSFSSFSWIRRLRRFFSLQRPDFRQRSCLPTSASSFWCWAWIWK